MATTFEKIMSLFRQSPEAAAKAIANTADMAQLAENLDLASKEAGDNAPDRLIPRSEIETAVKEAAGVAVKDAFNNIAVKDIDPEMAKMLGDLLTMFNSVSVDIYGYAYKELATKEKREPLFVSAEKHAELETTVKEQATIIEAQQEKLKELGADMPSGLASLMNAFRASESKETVVDKPADIETQVKERAAKQVNDLNAWMKTA